MTEPDAFDAFLKSAMAPPDRDEDLHFAQRVAQGIRLDEALRGARRATLRRLGLQFLSLGALAAAFAAVGLAAPVRAAMGEMPHVGLAILLTVFAFWVALLASERRSAAFT